MTKVSLPVIINEPLGTLQKTCEMLVIYQDLLVRAAKHQDPLMRLTLACVSIVAGFNCVRVVRKKPFNPVLGETFEYVSEEFRYISEQVSHHPPISAYHIEGEGYWGCGHSCIDP